MSKKDIRRAFRDVVFERDKYKCKMCGKPASVVHHIVDRSEMPGGGYVPENGISLDNDCHLKAEAFHQFGKSFPGYSPEELYAVIGSNKDTAVEKSYECLEVDGQD